MRQEFHLDPNHMDDLNMFNIQTDSVYLNMVEVEIHTGA